MVAATGFYSLVDHTADLGIKVHGQTFVSLLEHAAYALFDIITDISSVRPGHHVRVEMPAGDSEGTLRQWLEDLLFRFNGYDYLFSKFQVSAEDHGRHAGQAWGEVFDPNRHVIHTEIKGITYHQFEVLETSEEWSARIIFDV